MQRKHHIFEVGSRRELRQCSHCLDWAPLSAFFMHAHLMSNICKPCERERAREYGRANVARQVANAKRWAAANPDKIKARKPRYQRKYAEANRTKIRTRMQAYMQVKSKTPEYRAQQREYDARTGKGAEKAARRRATINGVTVAPVDRNAIIKRDRRICYLCGIKVKWREVTLDHVIPLARGGSHTPENLRVACGPCNFSKRDRPIGQLSLI